MDLCELHASRDRDVRRHPWETTRQEFILDLVARLRGKHRLQRILDLGCGDVFVGKGLARKYPWIRLDAVDPGFTPHTIARVKAGDCPANLHMSPSLDALAADDGKVGLVLLLDVLEHVEQDGGFLKSVVGSPLISPRAHFLITVPAFRTLYCSHDRLLGHYRRYSLGAARETVAAAGLTVVEAGYAFLSGFWIRALRKGLEAGRIVKPLDRTEITDWEQGAAVTWLVNTLLRWDLRVSTWLAKYRLPVPGLSCYLICRKRA